MLSAVGGFGSCRVNDPLAGDVSRNIGLIAALALMPVVGAVILPIGAVAVDMARRRILIGGLELHIIAGHGEGGSRLGSVCQSDIALQHDPLVKDLAGLRCVRRNGHNGVLRDLVRDWCSCGNGGRALDNCERIRLYGVLGELRLDRYIVCGHDEGGGGAGLVSQCYAACLNDPLDEVCSGRSLRRNGDLNALHGAGDGCACGNGCRAAGDGNGVIPQGGDLGVLAALIAADGTLLMLQAGLGRGGRLVYLPHEGVGGQFRCAGARIRAGAVGTLMPMARRVLVPRAAGVGMGVGPLICAHGDGLPDLDIAIAAAIVILDRHILLSLRELVTIEDRIAGFREDSLSAIGIMRSDHHARRVEFLTGLVLGLGGRCCDLNVIHLLDDLQHLKLVEYPHIAARLSRWILKFACLFPVYGHLIPCKTGVGIPRFCVNQDFYPILDICLNRGIRCQIIPAAACITLLDGNLIDSNAHLVFC